MTDWIITPLGHITKFYSAEWELPKAITDIFKEHEVVKCKKKKAAKTVRKTKRKKKKITKINFVGTLYELAEQVAALTVSVDAFGDMINTVYSFVQKSVAPAANDFEPPTPSDEHFESEHSDAD